VQVISLKDAFHPLPKSMASFLALPLLVDAGRLRVGEAISQEGFTLLDTLSTRLSLSREVKTPTALARLQYKFLSFEVLVVSWSINPAQPTFLAGVLKRDGRSGK
jgi:hypothetical protein